jgi:hypothetical protein
MQDADSPSPGEKGNEELVPLVPFQQPQHLERVRWAVAAARRLQRGEPRCGILPYAHHNRRRGGRRDASLSFFFFLSFCLPFAFRSLTGRKGRKEVEAKKRWGGALGGICMGQPERGGNKNGYHGARSVGLNTFVPAVARWWHGWRSMPYSAI